MRIIEKLGEDNIYHIYNRGINGEDIFREKRNYYYFLKQYHKYCSPFLDTYAYVLLKNHFHLLVKVKPAVWELSYMDGHIIQRHATKQLSHFFNSYAQSFNKAYKRHGKLFEEPFRRKEVKTDAYFTGLIYYLHQNPQHHGFVNDFREWEFSSYQDMIAENSHLVNYQQVIEWFGSKQYFTEAHLLQLDIGQIGDFIIE